MRYVFNSPLSRVFAALIAVLVTAAVLFFGFVAFLFLLGLAAVGGLLGGVRGWWLSRTVGTPNAASKSGDQGGRIIEAEYEVLSRRRD